MSAADVDFSLGITTTFEEQGLFAIRDVATLPASGTRVGEKVFNRTDGRLYEWTGSAWGLVLAGAAATDITGALVETQISDAAITTAKIAAGSITAAKISASTITGDKISAGTITTALLAVGAVRANNMVIDENLSINAASAGFQMGKLSAADLENEGIYMGRTAEVGGGTGFGFLAGKTIGGVRRYLQATTADGLKIVNAKHRIDNSTPSAPVVLATSQTYTITPGTSSVTIQLIGGGGGGASSSWDNVNSGCSAAGIVPGTAGTATTVALYDGATPTGQTWTSAGAAGGSGGGVSTANPSLWSPYGNGGAGGAGGTWTTGKDDQNSHCVVGGSRGAAASLITATDIDVSGLTAPKLVVTVGAAGVGGTGGVAGIDRSSARHRKTAPIS